MPDAIYNVSTRGRRGVGLDFYKTSFIVML